MHLKKTWPEKTMTAGIFLVIALALLPCFWSVRLLYGESDDLLSSPVKHLESYKFNPETPLLERVGDIPPFVLEAWRVWDDKKNYRPYAPTSKEMEIIASALSELPPLSREVMRERLIGVYFVRNFLGSGLTDWVVDKDNNIYTYMIFNPETLKRNLSELITWKERTCFIENDRSAKLNIELNSEMNGFIYIILHESAHVVDYVENITPFTEPYMKRFMKEVPFVTPFTAGIWSSYNETFSGFSFREGVSFYGMGSGPRVRISEAPELYGMLAKSPFISLYGTLNWAEDLAEFLSFYHLTQKMGIRYRITVSSENGLVYALEPAENEMVKKRFTSMQLFYQPRSLWKNR
jgi:hypothetical protein